MAMFIVSPSGGFSRNMTKYYKLLRSHRSFGSCIFPSFKKTVVEYIRI